MSAAAAWRAAEGAVGAIGCGYDLAVDFRLTYCKKNSVDSRLIAIDDKRTHDVVIPGGILIPGVSKSIKCDKGERMRFASDVLSFQQMSEYFNQDSSLSGKIPSGHFNSSFDFTAGWQKDAASTKTVAFDGVVITLYNIALEKSQLFLRDHVKQAVPSTWDPAKLANFIEQYGTHVIVGLKIGGKDTIYMKQQHSSPVEPADVQKKLKNMADMVFADGMVKQSMNSEKLNEKEKSINEHRSAFMETIPTSSYSVAQLEDIKFMCKRKGGSLMKKLSHVEWCQTVQFEPDVISMSFVPISSLLSGIQGSGFLSHAINLYLRYKPQIEELHQFLEFQLPRQWAPLFGNFPLGPDRKLQPGASLQLSFMGPKLYVNTTPVDVGMKPVTGLRLYLEGKRSNCLAIHLQHLSTLPNIFQLQKERIDSAFSNFSNSRYYEKVQWKSFSHICTAPVESNDDHAVVTGAHFEVGESGLKKVLFLRLHFSKLVGATTVKQPEWDGSPGLIQKSGIISTLISTRLSTPLKPPPNSADININSAIYPDGPPRPTQAPKLLKFVDTTEMSRGPQDSPGYWVVSGAKLHVEQGKISLRVKYALLTVISPEEEMSMEF